jgi:hypothetical protein
MLLGQFENVTLKYQFSDSEQIQQLGGFNSNQDKYKNDSRPADRPASFWCQSP